jgi:hypothetical protein
MNVLCSDVQQAPEENFQSRQVRGGVAVLGLGPREGDWSDLWIERHHGARSDLG